MPDNVEMIEQNEVRRAVGWYVNDEGVRRFWDGTCWFRPSAMDMQPLAATG